MSLDIMVIELVKPIAGILTGKPDLVDDVHRALADRFGEIDIVGEAIPFDHTSYYADEMGAGLARRFVSFEGLASPDDAARFKVWTREAEDLFREGGRRTVNIDPGYVDANKVVLLTGKHGGHRIALAQGIWADLLLWYNKGWVALPWAYPDFKDGRLFPLFTKMRDRFKEQLRCS